MKLITYILTFFILASCGQSNSDKESENEISAESNTVMVESKADTTKLNLKQSSSEQTEQNNQDLNNEFKEATIFKLTDTINADFNGDGNNDQAVFKKENETSGIIITHGLTYEKVKIGFGEQFAHLTEFNWADYWGLVKDSKSYEIVIEDAEIIGEREVKLDYPSIVVRKEEVGGGLITFKDGKYIWIHQAD
ncbi:hypothetical protein [Flagellimonas sediminis]|uniref:Lipoprotein n=1 Tax=Flagellimonas sediminis TaxID=2696468 RepID=A0A6I5L6K1_9FLAO|nr:hypothetical protein [Allomuricauda sediminis]NDV45401.1 hypothetical protein [Allomuricauda sediminis]